MALGACGGGGGGPTGDISLVPAELPQATLGQAYQATIQAQNASPPLTWQITAGALPSGLTFCTGNTTGACALGGTPTEWRATPFSITVRAADAKRSALKSYSLTVNPSGGALAVQTESLPAAARGMPYTASVKAAGGLAGYAWSLASGSLPPGIAYCSSETASVCNLSGTPTASGEFRFRVQITDSNVPAQAAARDLSILVTGLQRTITLSVSGNGTVTSGESPAQIDCGVRCVGSFEDGSVVRLTATPTFGESLIGWGGDCAGAGTTATLDLTMDGDKTCSAAFSSRYLPGATEDLASARLPTVPLPPADVADIATDTRPNGSGLPTSRTRLLVLLSEAATVGEVNATLANLGATIGGTMPEIGMMLVILPDTGDFTGLENALQVMSGHPAFALSVQDVVLEPSMIALPSSAKDPNVADFCPSCPAANTEHVWRWVWPLTLTVPPGVEAASEATWGLHALRVPWMWNLNDYASRQAQSPRIAVLDVGFNDLDFDGRNDHPNGDLASLSTYYHSSGPERFIKGANAAVHGEIMAGIIGAAFNNPTGIQGVNPFVERHDPPDDHFLGISSSVVGGLSQTLGGNVFSAVLTTLRDMLKAWELRVVNISLGYNFGANGVNPNGKPEAQEVATKEGFIARKIFRGSPNTLFVVSAGNDSSQRYGFAEEVLATWSSPFNWAALGPSVMLAGETVPAAENVIVVEAVDPVVEDTAVPHMLDLRFRKSDLSNVGGHVAAPGGRTLTVVGSNFRRPQGLPPFNNYETVDGTSMSAAYITGLASYLLTLDSALTAAELRSLLVSTFPARETFARPQDPLPAGVSPARLADAFSSALLIDNIRGNQAIARALVDVDDGTLDGNTRTTRRTDGSILDDFVLTSDGRRGDGVINMADFRAFRDAVVATMVAPENSSLDGSPTHFKRDLNFDGCIQSAVVSSAVASPPHPTAQLPRAATDCSDAPAEQRFSRFDFNGDGEVSTTRRSPVGARMLTDADMLIEVWPTDPALNEGWNKEDLMSLLPPGGGSGELWFASGLTLVAAEIDEIRITINHNGRAVTRSIGPTDGRIVWTVPANISIPVTVQGYRNGSPVAKKLCLNAQNPVAPLKHGEDRDIDVVDCGNPPFINASYSVLARACRASCSSGSWVYEQTLGGPFMEQITCAPFDIGGSCTLTKPVHLMYSSSDNEVTISQPSGREWRVTVRLTTEARQPPFTDPAPYTCAGGYPCQSSSVHSMDILGTVPIKILPARNRRVTVECSGTGDILAVNGVEKSYTSMSVYSRYPDVRLQSCGTSSSAGAPGWSVASSEAFDRNSDSYDIWFSVATHAEAFKSVNISGLPPDFEHQVTAQILSLRITISDL